MPSHSTHLSCKIAQAFIQEKLSSARIVSFDFWSFGAHIGHDNLHILGNPLPIPILNGHLIKQQSHQTYDQTHVLLLSMVSKWLASVIQQHRLEKWWTVASLRVLRRWKRLIIGGSHAWRCRLNTVEVLDRGDWCIALKWYS